MNVKLLFFASHKRTAGLSETDIDLSNAATVREAAHLVELKFNLELAGSMVAVNDEYATPDVVLKSGDTLAFIPPVAGGEPENDFFLVSSDPLPITDLHAKLIRPEWGGQAMFTGSTRSPNKNLEILKLEYEAYPALCQNVMRDLTLEARATWELGVVVLAHRTGIVLPGEISIFVGVGSSHRTACLAAVPWLVDEAKSRLPVWKLEVAATGERWVEGATSQPTL
jgi:MoaE-MoaD fusion protein